MKTKSENKQSRGIDPYRIRYRFKRKEIMNYIVKNGIVGDEIIGEINRYSTECCIEQPEKFLALTLEALEHLHTGALIAIRVNEAEFWEWKKKFDEVKSD